ncbi:MAG: LamG domain-containing protein [Pseudomonadota bacterium]
MVEILNSAGSLKLLTNASLFNGSYTKMAWVNLNSTNYRNHLISGNNATQSHYLYVSQPSKFLSAGHSSSTNPVNIYGQETSISPINVWRHIAVTYAISTQTMVLYVNGVAVSTNTAVPVATQATGSVNLDMSGYGSNVGFGLDGMMISNKVYSRALSASEVSAVFSFEQMRLWKAVIFLNPYPPLAVKVGGGKYQDNRTLKHVHNII